MRTDEYSEEKEFNLFALVVCIAIPLIAGGIAAYFTKNAPIAFVRIAKPPFVLPAWLFSAMWLVLYVLIGIASYVIYRSNHDNSNIALTIYGVTILFNFIWFFLFFKNGTYWVSAAWLMLLWLLILLLVIVTRTISRTATCLLIPYLIWSTYVCYLNVGIAILNR